MLTTQSSVGVQNAWIYEYTCTPAIGLHGVNRVYCATIYCPADPIGQIFMLYADRRNLDDVVSGFRRKVNENCVLLGYRVADKSLARPGRKRATATEDFEFHISQRLRWSRGSVLAFSTQVRGIKPGPSRRIFKGENNPQHAFLRRGSKAVGPMS